MFLPHRYEYNTSQTQTDKHDQHCNIKTSVFYKCSELLLLADITLETTETQDEDKSL